MHRWKTWSALLFAVVLSLGMIGVAAADPPDPHPACEKENPPPGCEDDGHPGDPDEDDEDDGNGEDPGGDANPLAPLGEACSQVVQAIAGGDPTGQAVQLHALCEALGAEPLDDGGEPEPEPVPCEEDPEAEGCEDEGGEAAPTQPIADGCMEVVNGLVDNGVPAGDGEQLCAQFGDTGGDDAEPEPDPCEEDPEAEGCDDGEGDGGSSLGDGCNQVVDALTGVSEEFEQGSALCEQAP